MELMVAASSVGLHPPMVVGLGGGPSHRRSPLPAKDDIVAGIDDDQAAAEAEATRGGFDMEFSPAPEPKYICPICIMVLRDPIQTNCGHRFCRSCLFHWLRQSPLCPTCKASIQRSDTFADNYAKREILGFTVHCPNRKNGCETTLELRDFDRHQSDTCLYVYCTCPKGCLQKVLRKDMQSHLDNTCPANRNHICELCGSMVHFVDRKSHISSCQGVQQLCKFCSEMVAKSEMSAHLKETCSAVTVQCKFQHFGCSEQCQRQHMAIHNLRNLPDHLELLARYVLQSDQTVDCKVTSVLQMLALNEKDLDSTSFYNKSINTERARRNVKHYSEHSDTQEDGLMEKPHQLEKWSMAQGSIKSSAGKKDEELRKSVMSLEWTVKEQAKKLVEYTDYIKRLEHMIYDLGTKTSHGIYIWKIPDFKKRFQEAKTNKNSILYSPGFYSSYYGYKACIRVHLNGTGSAWGKHLSLFVHFMPGEFDDILQWPFHGSITLSILDQNDNFKLRSDIRESMEPNPQLEAFERPRETRNHKGFGYIEFVSLPTLLGSNFVNGDALYIKASVDSQRLPSQHKCGHSTAT